MWRLLLQLRSRLCIEFEVEGDIVRRFHTFSSPMLQAGHLVHLTHRPLVLALLVAVHVDIRMVTHVVRVLSRRRVVVMSLCIRLLGVNRRWILTIDNIFEDLDAVGVLLSDDLEDSGGFFIKDLHGVLRAFEDLDDLVERVLPDLLL